MEKLNSIDIIIQNKQRLLPNLLIVGAAKSGSTLLADCLGQHPEIYMSPVKEPHYFVPNLAVDSLEEYCSLFNNATQEKIRAEASTGYLYSEDAAKAIKKNLPNTKIIMILRNPVEMAFSYWAFMSRRGNETESFETAIATQDQRWSEEFMASRVGWPYSYLYIERAKYYHQVKRYLDLFGRDQVKVLIFEEFLQAPQKSFIEIFNFLEVTSSFKPQIKQVNPGGVIRSKQIEWIIQQEFPLIKNIIPLVWRDKIRTFMRDVNVKTGEKPVLSPEMRQKLTKMFSEDVNLLESLLGRKLWKHFE